MRFSAALFISILATAAVADTTGNTWSTYQGNNQHTGFANVEINPAKFQILWTRKVDSTATVSGVTFGHPIVSPNAVYFHFKNNLSNKDTMLALNVTDGETLWQSQVPAKFSNPSYDNGKLYYLSEAAANRLHDTKLQIADAMTGQILASTSVLLADDNWHKQTPIVDNHQVLVGSSHVQYSLDADTGVQRWKSATVEGDELTATVSDNAVMRYMYNSIALLDKLTGKLDVAIPVIPTNMYQLTSYPLVYDKNSQTIYAAFAPGDDCADDKCLVVTAININNGEPKWGRLGLGFTSQLAIDAGHMFMVLRINNENGWLVSMNADSGRDEWYWEAPKALTGQMIVTPNAIILNANTVIYFLSRLTHQLLGFVPAKSSGSMAVSGDVLFVTDDLAGTVTAIKVA